MSTLRKQFRPLLLTGFIALCLVFVLPIFLNYSATAFAETKPATTTKPPATTTTTPKTTPTLDAKTLAEIEKKVKAEYNKVYAAEIKKGTKEAKAKDVAKAAADKLRAELIAKATKSGSTGVPQEAAGYVARTYDGVDWEGALSIKNPSGAGDIAELITKLINWLLMIIAMVATVVIIYSGIMMVFNSGNESAIKTAKTSLQWAIIGLIVSVSAFAIVNIVESLL